MSLVQYVFTNYVDLPKSMFNDKELVIVEEYDNDEGGYGHHYYSGIGIDRDGSVFYCYSSGCSCNGSCGAEEQHLLNGKIIEIHLDGKYNTLRESIPTAEEFAEMKVEFSDY